MTPTEQQWLERVRAWRESGATAREFAQGRGYAANTLLQWSHVLKKRGRSRAAGATGAAVRLARVERVALAPTAPPAPAVVTVELGGARVSIPGGADAATVRTVLEALRDRAEVAGP